MALVGYTNAGKSTVMNAMLSAYDGEGEKMVYEEDMLFATLDTTVRRITPPDQNDFLLSDTVGFISNLPHNLVKAFRSTLEEVREADLLIQVIDYSDENYTRFPCIGVSHQRHPRNPRSSALFALCFPLS